jgi:hypothetical protein
LLLYAIPAPTSLDARNRPILAKIVANGYRPDLRQQHPRTVQDIYERDVPDWTLAAYSADFQEVTKLIFFNNKGFWHCLHSIYFGCVQRQ